MDGIHDLGGMQGFGHVDVGPADEPPFPEPWHGRVHGMMLGLALSGNLPRGFRYAIERMDPGTYLATGYYEHWLHAVETLLEEAGTIAPADVDRQLGSEPPRDVESTSAADWAQQVHSLFQHRPGKQLQGPLPAHRPGDRVRVRKHFGPEHNRCPRYVRGAVGVVEDVGAPSPLHDAHVVGRLEPHPVYRIVFDSAVLWGLEAEPFTVRLDLWAPYLEEAHE